MIFRQGMVMPAITAELSYDWDFLNNRNTETNNTFFLHIVWYRGSTFIQICYRPPIIYSISSQQFPAHGYYFLAAYIVSIWDKLNAIKAALQIVLIQNCTK